MRKRALTAIPAMLISLAGCAASYPPLYTSPVASKPASETNIERILREAGERQKLFEERYIRTAKAMDASQLPLIAAATGAAIVLYDNPKDALDILAGIGIGTGAYTATRSTLLPSKMPELYIMGHSALGCIREEGPAFAGAAAKTRRDRFQTLIAQLSREVGNARQVYQATSLDATPTNEQKQAFQLAMSALNEAIVAASVSVGTGNRQLALFNSADTVFGSAVSSVHTRLATKAREGRAVDFGQARQQITNNIAAAGQPPPPVGAAAVGAAVAALTNDEKIEILRTKTREVLDAHQALNAEAPDYQSALQRVAACPNLVT